MKYISGDIGLSASKGLLGKGIRFFTSLHTQNAEYNHVFACVGWGIIVEALAKITINREERYKDKKHCVYRIPLTDEERSNFKLGMLRRHNKAYGYGKLLLFVLDAVSTQVTRIFGRKRPVFFWTKTFGITNIPVCSQLVVWGLHEFTNYRLKNMFDEVVDWKTISPDYLHDLLESENNKAELIYKHA